MAVSSTVTNPLVEWGEPIEHHGEHCPIFIEPDDPVWIRLRYHGEFIPGYILWRNAMGLRWTHNDKGVDPFSDIIAYRLKKDHYAYRGNLTATPKIHAGEAIDELAAERMRRNPLYGLF